MPTPDYRHERRSANEPYIEERTFYSKEKDKNGSPVRTYHARRVDVGHGWSHEVSMEVVAKDAAVDILGRSAGPNENTRTIWEQIWPS
jgi:hypothetical protein